MSGTALVTPIPTPENDGQGIKLDDPLINAAQDVIVAMINLCKAYKTLEGIARTDDLRRWCLTEQANFYTDKSLIISKLRTEGLELLTQVQA